MGIEINIPRNTFSAATFGYLDFSKFSQSFLGGFDLLSISCSFSVGAGSPGLVAMNIYQGSFPQGASLGSATADGDSVTAVYTSSNLLVFTFSPVITLTPATTYCFSLEIANEDYSTHYLHLHDTTPSSYANGQEYRYKDTIPEWQSVSAYDIISVIRSPDAPGKAQNPTPEDDEGNIKITGKSQLKKLQWEAPD